MFNDSLLWRSRRGTREMDILLQGFIRQHYAHLSAQDKSIFTRLLEQPDPDIMDWIMERQEAPADFRPLIGMIRAADANHEFLR